MSASRGGRFLAPSLRRSHKLLRLRSQEPFIANPGSGQELPAGIPVFSTFTHWEGTELMNDYEAFDAAEVYVIALNGGAPTTDWTERSGWVESICKPRGDVLPKTKGGAR